MTRKRWKNPDKRMAQAVELRARGWSLRRIGTELAVSEGTVRNDLARWGHIQTELESNVVVYLHRPGAQRTIRQPPTPPPPPTRAKGARQWWQPPTKKRWKDPERRMDQVAERRAEGQSLREIATALAVSVGTIHSDLARWELRNQAVQLNANCAGIEQGITQREEGA